MTETRLITIGGLTQYAKDDAAMIDSYNRLGSMFEVRIGPYGGREMWHKGSRRLVGTLVTIPAREAS
jgi:hypothetical protein